MLHALFDIFRFVISQYSNCQYRKYLTVKSVFIVYLCSHWLIKNIKFIKFQMLPGELLLHVRACAVVPLAGHVPVARLRGLHLGGAPQPGGAVVLRRAARVGRAL